MGVGEDVPGAIRRVVLGEDVIRVYRSSDPDKPAIYRRGEIAEAEPAVPGWRMAVDELFPEHFEK